MKNLKSAAVAKCDKLDQQWRSFPREKQQKWVIGFFVGYLILTAVVVLTVWHDNKTQTAKSNILTGHIRNPITEKERQVKDSIKKKNQDYERR